MVTMTAFGGFLSSYNLFNLLFAPISALVTLVLALAASGASLRIREMYVKALLKIFEYATNIKQQKISHHQVHDNVFDFDDPFQVDAKTEFERERQLARIQRLRHESFKLRTTSQSSSVNESIVSDQTYATAQTQHPSDLIVKDSNDNFTKFNEHIEMLDKFKSKIGICKLTDIDHDCLIKPPNGSSYNPFNGHDSNCGGGAHDNRKNFHLGDIMGFVNKGIDSIIDDDVTKRFTTEELTVWNLLTRTNQQYEYVSFRVTILWLLGFILRYFILFPFRLILFFFACSYTLVTTSLIGHVRDGRFKRWLNNHMSMILHRILSRVFSAIITIHNRENRAKSGSICVANHTSPIDVIILSTDNTYSLIGQSHGGFTGMMQRAFSRASRHIWFERSETKDRSTVSKRMSEHVKNPDNCPLLIFPEGTCINNTSVMMFKKGCFEIDSTIYPVAIKYDPRFGDAFWNSGKHSMLQYLILMMTSWAIVVDVYYLPPMKREQNEDVLQFTNRVKTEIVKKGSFVDLNWDGMLKRSTPKLDLLYEQQQNYVRQLKID